MSVLRIVILLVLASLSSSCTDSFSSVQEMYAWLHTPSNGCTIIHSIDDMEYQATYLPSEYVAYRQVGGKKMSPSEKDSLMKAVSANRSFLFRIGRKINGKNVDVMMSTNENYNEYKEMIETLNFNLSEYLYLDADGQKIPLSVSTLENNYGLKKTRDLFLVFSPIQDKNQLVNAKEITLVFNDQIFETGVTRFSFTNNVLNNIPNLSFWK